MDIQIIFHILAALCGAIVVVISFTGSFKNKFKIICIVVALGLIFEIAIPFLKTNKPPEISYSLKLLDSNYSPDVKVDGVKWEESYRRYSFELNAKPNTTEAYDIRLSFALPTGVVTYHVLSKTGCEDLNFPTRSTSFHHISDEGKMIDQVPFYQNTFYVNILKMLPKAKLKIHLILTYPLGIVDKDYGIFDVEYNYKDSSDSTIVVNRRHAILFKDKKTMELIIESTKESGPEIKFYHVMIPKEKIKVPFEKGKGIKFHMLPSKLKEEDNN